jgi:hypothetical protein
MQNEVMKNLSSAVLVVLLTGWAARARGMGGDYANGEQVSNPSWPKGMSELVNTSNRIGGLWVNAGDTFFFAGTKTNFNEFLEAYSKIQSIEKHRLILHDGAGEAFDLGGGNRRPCDWKVEGAPRAWLDGHQDGITRTAKDTNYVLEVHFWTGGKIAFEPATIPKNVEVIKTTGNAGK